MKIICNCFYDLNDNHVLLLMCCRGHRDDQSAFTFLIAKYFDFGINSKRKVFLNDYSEVFRRQRSTVASLKYHTHDYSCMTLFWQKKRMSTNSRRQKLNRNSREGSLFT